MNRRHFLRHGSLLTLGGLIAGPEALEALARLTWKRKFFPGFTPSITMASWRQVDFNNDLLLCMLYTEDGKLVSPKGWDLLETRLLDDQKGRMSVFAQGQPKHPLSVERVHPIVYVEQGSRTIGMRHQSPNSDGVR